MIQAGRIGHELGMAKPSVVRHLKRLSRHRYLDVESTALGFRLRVMGQKKFRDQTQALMDKVAAVGYGVGGSSPRSCGYCSAIEDGRRVFLQEDHFAPLSRGGPTGPENVVLACIACNQLKGDRIFRDLDSCARWLRNIYDGISTGSTEITDRTQVGVSLLLSKRSDLISRETEVIVPIDLGSSSDLDLRSRSEKGEEKRERRPPSLPVENPEEQPQPTCTELRGDSECGRTPATGYPPRCIECRREILRALVREIGRGVPEVIR